MFPNPSEEEMSENELFSNIDISGLTDAKCDKRESFGRMTEQINENKIMD